MNPAKTTIGKFILASVSPRRRQLLREAGFDFEVVAPPIAEPDRLRGGLSPAEQAEALAYFKARAVARLHPEAVVLAADTLVSAGGRVLGKATSSAQARTMLGRLSGTRHAVITGVAVLGAAGRRQIASETTYVTMRGLSAAAIEAYVASDEWVDKAGAYAIQETADRFVRRVEGSFTNVVGLPMELTGRLLARFGRGPAPARRRT